MSDARRDPAYVAFLSYRHAEEDRRWAAWLLKRIETYRVPARLVRDHGISRRLGRVFRDEEELAAAPDLSATIREALEKSGHLIVVCSPRTPSSTWVNREIETFRDAGRSDRVLAFLVEGEPDESFPPALRSLVPVPLDAATTLDASRIEPLAADARPRHGLSAAQARHTALLRVLSRLIGCRYDELRQRDLARRQRFWVAATAAAIVLAAMLAVLSILAVTQRNEARLQLGRARALGLTQASIEESTRDPTLSLLLARKAIEFQDGFRSRSQLREALVGSSRRGVSRDPPPGEDEVLISAQGDRSMRLVSNGNRGRVVLLDEGAGTLAEVSRVGVRARPAFSVDGRFAVIPGEQGEVVLLDRAGARTAGAKESGLGAADGLAMDGSSVWTLHGRTLRRLVLPDLRVVARWDLPVDGAITVLPGPEEDHPFVGLRDGSVLKADGSGGFVEVLAKSASNRSEESAEYVWQVPGRVLLVKPDGYDWKRIDLSGRKEPLDLDSRLVAVSPAFGLRAVGHLSSTVTIVDEDDETLQEHEIRAVRTLRADATGPEFVAVTEAGQVLVLTHDREPLSVPLDPKYHPQSAASTRGGTVLTLASSDGAIGTFDAGRGDLGLYGAPDPAGGTSPWLAASEAFVALEGKAVVLRDRDGRVKTVCLGARSKLTTAATSPDGKIVAAGEGDGHVLVWTQDGTLLARIEAHTASVLSILFDPSRPSRLLSASADGAATIWDSSGRRLATLRGHTGPVKHLAISFDGSRILTSDGREAARLWDGEGNPIRLLEMPLPPGADSPVLLLARSATEAVVTAGFFAKSRHIALVNASVAAVFGDDGQRLTTVPSTGGRLTGMLSPSGHLLLFGARLRVLDPDGNLVKAVDRSVKGAGLEDGRDRAVVWDISRVAELLQFGSTHGTTMGGHRAAVSACTFGLAGGRIATGTEDGSVHFWSSWGEPVSSVHGGNRGVEKRPLRGSPARALGAAVLALHPSPDGRRLLAQEESGLMRLLLVEPREVETVAAARSFRDMTQAEMSTYAEFLSAPGPEPQPTLLREGVKALDEALDAEAGQDEDAKRDSLGRMIQAARALSPDAPPNMEAQALIAAATAENPDEGRRLVEKLGGVVKRQATLRKLGTLRQRLESFKAKVGHYPTADEGILALDPTGTATTESSFQFSPILDGWGALFLYVVKGDGYELSSAGPDGRHHTADDVK